MSTYPINNLVLSHFSRGTFRSCARKFEMAKMFGDSISKEEQFAGTVGNALHDGFQEFLVSHDEVKAHMAMMKTYPYKLEFDAPGNSTRSLEACYSTLSAMFHSPIAGQYEVAHIATRFGDTRPAIEVPFAFQITNSPLSIPVYFVGFVDAILYDKHEKEFAVVDIKTTRMSVSDYSARYEFDEQTVPYAIVLEHMLGNTISQLKTKYLSVYIDLMEPKVAMYAFNKTQDHVRDWHRGLCEDIFRISKYYENEWFPRATDGTTCFSFNKPCWFSDYCSYRDPAVIKRMLNTEVRAGLFHDDKEPWVIAELPYVNPYERK